MLIGGRGSNKDDENTIVASNGLWSVRDNIELLFELLSKDVRDTNIENKVALSILLEVLAVRLLEPNIEKLTAVPLETLCLLNDERIRNTLNALDREKLVSLANEYLNQVQQPVMTEIKDRQSTFRGQGCYLTPKFGDPPNKPMTQE